MDAFWVLLTFFIPLSLSQTIVVSTPATPASCSAVSLTWTANPSGTALAPPFAVSIHDPSTGGLIEDLGQTTTPSLSWTINLPSGDTVQVHVSDNAGNSGDSAPFQITKSSTSTDCTPGHTGGGGGGGTSIITTSHRPPPTHTITSVDQTTTTTTATTTTITSTPTPTTTSSDPPTTSSTSLSSSSTSFLVPSSQSSTSLVTDITTETTPPTIDVLPTTTDDPTNSSGTSQDNTTGISKPGATLSGPIIGAIVAGGVALVVVVFFVVLRCRRRRRRVRETMLYPFDMSDHKSDLSRETRGGRAGRPLSRFSSWGNRGEMGTDDQDRIVSPTSEGHHQGFNNGPAAYPTTYNNPVSPWDGPGTTEAAYDGVQQLEPTAIDPRTMAGAGYGYNYTPQAPNSAIPLVAIGAPPSDPSREPPQVQNAAAGVSPFVSQIRQANGSGRGNGHGHGTSTSIDLDAGRRAPSEPGSPAHPGQRFRGPMQKSMVDAYRAGLVGPNSHSGLTAGYDPQGYPPAPASMQSQAYAYPYAYTGLSTVPVPVNEPQAQAQFESQMQPTTNIGRAPSYKTYATMGDIPPVPRLPQPGNPPAAAEQVVNYPPPYTST